MNKNKKIFIGAFIIFMIIMVLIGIDISRKTTFPGSKPNAQERLLDK